MGERSTINSLPALKKISGDLLAHTNFTFLRKGRFTVAQRAETTVAECSMTIRLRARFLIGSLNIP